MRERIQDLQKSIGGRRRARARNRQERSPRLRSRLGQNTHDTPVPNRRPTPYPWNESAASRAVQRVITKLGSLSLGRSDDPTVVHHKQPNDSDIYGASPQIPFAPPPQPQPQPQPAPNHPPQPGRVKELMDLLNPPQPVPPVNPGNNILPGFDFLLRNRPGQNDAGPGPLGANFGAEAANRAAQVAQQGFNNLSAYGVTGWSEPPPPPPPADDPMVPDQPKQDDQGDQGGDQGGGQGAQDDGDGTGGSPSGSPGTTAVTKWMKSLPSEPYTQRHVSDSGEPDDPDVCEKGSDEDVSTFGIG
ncbi:hypothetical protein F4774DRAFT_430159 [Daldinia eschscholtzii]|nr:hypothetical protein F4774DRAFT_430159 [Daldinia eschscholtzii]